MLSFSFSEHITHYVKEPLKNPLFHLFPLTVPLWYKHLLSFTNINVSHDRSFIKSYCCYLQICAIACSHANRQGNRFRWMENCQTDRFYQPHTTVVSWTLFLNTNTMFSAVCFLLVIVLLFFPFYCSFPSLSIDFYQLISS